jgi:hypothetical protein
MQGGEGGKAKLSEEKKLAVAACKAEALTKSRRRGFPLQQIGPRPHPTKLLLSVANLQQQSRRPPPQIQHILIRGSKGCLGPWLPLLPYYYLSPLSYTEANEHKEEGQPPVSPTYFSLERGAILVRQVGVHVIIKRKQELDLLCYK